MEEQLRGRGRGDKVIKVATEIMVEVMTEVAEVTVAKVRRGGWICYQSSTKIWLFFLQSTTKMRLFLIRGMRP